MAESMADAAPADGTSDSIEHTLTLTPGLPWRDLGDRVVVFDPATSEVRTLAGSGPTVWRMIRTAGSEAEVRRELASLLGDDAENLAAATAFVEELVSLGIVRRGR
jgi:hypothetical protein